MAIAKRHSQLRRPLILPPDALEPDPAYRALLDWIWSFSARPRTVDGLAAQRALKLDRMRALLELLGRPEQHFDALLVAGTKGKGSTVAMLAASLERAGFLTGRYTSPHLVNWRERTCVNGIPVTPSQAVAIGAELRAAVERLPASLDAPTTFEVGTAFAFMHFARQRIDVAALEVGVGGAHDATNVVEPLVAVIAPVSYDHTPTLGSTLEAIAAHKAGILRANRPGVISPQPPEAVGAIERIAADAGATLVHVGRDWMWSGDPHAVDRARSPITIASADGRRIIRNVAVPLLGDHQRDNATAAAAALTELGQVDPRLAVPERAIREGIEAVEWPGRLQVLDTAPLLVVDGAHNAASAVALQHSIRDAFEYAALRLIVGLSQGKDASGVLGALAPMAREVVLTRSQHERSATPADLATIVRGVAPGADVSIAPDLEAALRAVRSRAGADDLVLITGSLFLVGEALVLRPA